MKHISININVEDVDPAEIKEIRKQMFKKAIAGLLALLLLFFFVNTVIIKHNYILNQKSKIFHKDNCFAIQNSYYAQDFESTFLEAIIKGYKPCAHCIA